MWALKIIISSMALALNSGHWVLPNISEQKLKGGTIYQCHKKTLHIMN